MVWLTDWSKRIKMTVDGSKVNETLTDFPIMISLASGTGRTNINVTDIFDELTVTNSGVVDSYTKFLLHTEGDSSSYTKTITLNGNPMQYATTSKFGGSMSFDGASDCLFLNDDDDWDFGSGNFTIDFWLKRTGLGLQYICGQGASSGAAGIPFFLRFTAGNLLEGGVSTTGSSWTLITSSVAYVDTAIWHHVAFVRNSNNLYLYWDGVQVATLSYSSAFYSSTNKLGVGSLGEYTSATFNGYLDEFRLSKGIARWTTSFSGALPSAPYTSSSGIDSYTKLMLHFDSDKGVTGHNITFNGDMDFNPTINKFRSGNNGYGSFYFDGTGDYVSIPSSEDWNFGSGDFTIDCWFYVPNVTGNKTIFAGNTDFWMGTFLIGNLMCYYASSNGTTWNLLVGDTGSLNGRGTIAVTAATWHHLAYVRNGDRWMGFIDGVMDINTVVAGSIIARSEAKNIGRWGNNTNYLDGYISEFRISKGIARWTMNFTPPAAPYPDYRDVYSYSPKKIALVTATASGSNQLYGEIEDWNPYDKKAILWTKYPALSSGVSSELYLYYDKNQPDNTTYIGYSGETSAYNVWNSNYKGVWHLSQRPLGVSNEIKDSTSIVGNGSRSGASVLLTPGKIDGALDFTGNYIDCGTNTAAALGDDVYATTMSFWFKSDTAGANRGIVGLDMFNATGGGYRFLANLNAGLLILSMDGNVFSQGYGFSDISSWHHVVVVYNGAYGDMYLDNVRVVHSAYTSDIDYIGAKVIIGAYYSSTYPFDGKIDEIQILSTSCSGGWVSANYYNQQNDFLTFGAPEGPARFLFNGYVKVAGSPVARTVYLHRRNTGELVGYGVSEASTGYFEIASDYWGYHYVVILPEVGDGYNLLTADQITPEV